jgi:hypothetical protein
MIFQYSLYLNINISGRKVFHVYYYRSSVLHAERIKGAASTVSYCYDAVIIRIPYPTHCFNRIRFIDIAIESTILSKFRRRLYLYFISIRIVKSHSLKHFNRSILSHRIYYFLTPWSFNNLLLLYKNFLYHFNFFFSIIILYILILTIYLFRDYYFILFHFSSIFKSLLLVIFKIRYISSDISDWYYLWIILYRPRRCLSTNLLALRKICD